MPSGLPTLFASYVQNATWEGDNNVLYLQVHPSLGRQCFACAAIGCLTAACMLAALPCWCTDALQMDMTP